MYVYLIHFDQPISADHTCQHYIGYAKHSMKKRLAEHKAGKQVANERGISYRIVRWWKGGRVKE